MKKINFMNIQIDNLSMNEAIEKIDSIIENKQNEYVVTPNVDHMIKLQYDVELQSVYKNAGLVLTDGQPLVWISKIFKTPIREKVSGSDLFPRLCELAAKRNYGMFFLGAQEGVAAKAASNLMKRFPGLKIVGTYAPPFGFQNNTKQLNKIEDMIHDAHPDILIVGLGCPKQEKYMYHNFRKLGVPISLGLGASLDFESGNIKRAPKWMRNSGTEWLYRLTQDPKRLFRRYLVDDVRILGLIYKYRNSFSEAE